MARSLRRAVAVVAVTAAGVSSLIFGAATAVAETANLSSAVAQPVASPTEVADAQDPMTRLGGCLAGGGTGDILLLIDESESVRETDPGNARVASAKYFVDQLAAYAARNGSPLNVQVATFSQAYEPLTGWLPLDTTQTPGVLSAVDELAQRNDGWETDYWSALDGAREVLAAVASQRSTPSCQAVVWFSDGELWYNPVPKGDARKGFAPDLVVEGQGAADRARELAKNDLCRGGGLADQLRTSGVLTFGIGLDGPGVPAGGFDLMESIVTGSSSSGQSCGDAVAPVPGAFFRASDIDSLLMAFDRLGTPGQAPITQRTGVCQVAVCADQGHRIVLDSSTPQATILATSDVESATLSVQTPSGTIVDIPRGSGTLAADGAQLTYAWPSERTVSIELDSAGSTSWKGLWQIAFTDPAGQSPDAISTSHIRVEGALVPAWVGGESVELHTGEIVEGQQIGLTMRDGAPADGRLIEGAMSYSAVLRDSAGTDWIVLETADPLRLTSPTDIDLTDVAVGAATMTLTSRITTAATEYQGQRLEGTPLAPETVTIPLTVSAPLSYPTVASTVDFGAVEAQTIDLRASLPVSGDGCVVIGDVEVEAGPADLGRVDVRPEDEGCLPASAGSIPLVLTTEHSGNGTLNGSVSIELRPSADGRPIASTVSFSASLSRPVEALNFWLTLVVALLLGPGLPLGLLFLFKWWTAVIPSRLLYGFLVPVQIADAEVIRDDLPFAIAEADLAQQVRVPSRARRLEIGGAVVKARVGASPFGRGHVTVEAPGRLAISNVGPGTDRTPRLARLPLNIHNHWVLLRTPGAPRGHSQVLVLLGASDRDTRERLERSIRDSASRLLDRLFEIEVSRGQAPAEAPRDADNPFAVASEGAGPDWSSFAATAGTTSAPTAAPGVAREASPWGATRPATPPDTSDGRAPSSNPSTPTPPTDDPGAPAGENPWRPGW